MATKNKYPLPAFYFSVSWGEIMNVNFSYSRVGSNTMGITVWFDDEWQPSDNPVITDDSGDFTANWVYSFNLK